MPSRSRGAVPVIHLGCIAFHVDLAAFSLHGKRAVAKMKDWWASATMPSRLAAGMAPRQEIGRLTSELRVDYLGMLNGWRIATLLSAVAGTLVWGYGDLLFS